MNKSALEGRRAEQVIRETSEESVWQIPGILVVDMPGGHRVRPR